METKYVDLLKQLATEIGRIEGERDALKIRVAAQSASNNTARDEINREYVCVLGGGCVHDAAPNCKWCTRNFWRV